ncbi:MAG: glycoside hydrolase family 10 protein [Oscillospiraceae bacterium]
MRDGKKNRRWVVLLAAALAVLLGVAAGVAIALGAAAKKPATQPNASLSQMPATSADASAAHEVAPPDAVGEVTPRDYVAMPQPDEMAAMWVSFLEWKQWDLSSEAAFRAAVGPALDNCAEMGLNTVIVAVRPFSDAIYPSALFPWSSLLSGTQGTDPGYDALAVLVEEAHTRALRCEAWLNPYRVQDTVNGPEQLSADNPAMANPAWVRDVGGNLWYDPGLAEVRQLVVQGVLEIVQGYDVDGIHFDDYFYPEFTAQQKQDGLDTAFDEAAYAAYGGPLSRADWRRENINQMVRSVYAAVKAANPTVSFGISVQGNNENNYTTMYADVREWLLWEGYVDYVMPQLYWGFEYRTSSGRDDYAFEKIAGQWAFFPRADGVRLYAGLGAYRIGAGDGGSNEQDEWFSGHNLADMVGALRRQDGFSGFALFRYEFLYLNDDALAAQEAAALAEVLAE